LFDITINADFTLAKKSGYESKVKTFSYRYGVFYNNKYTTKKNVYCFYSSKMKRLAKSLVKPAHKLCVFPNGETKIYYMNNEKRYERIRKYKLNLINMDFLIENTKFNDKCRNSDINALEFSQKILQCMEKLKKYAR